jgi:SAM-dependent methyltransferase
MFGPFSRKARSTNLAAHLPREPASRVFGLDLGDAIDRRYIEAFLAANAAKIAGDVLEIADSTYTRKFGGERVRRALVLHATRDNPAADIVGDLATGEGIGEAIADCFILTQTLPFLFDVRGAARHAVRSLRPGGHLLVTVPGITQISRYDMDRWGHFWSFTDLSLRRLFEEVAPRECVTVETYGNVKVAASFLYGLPQQALSQEDWDRRDPDYQVTIAAVVRRP